MPSIRLTQKKRTPSRLASGLSSCSGLGLRNRPYRATWLTCIVAALGIAGCGPSDSKKETIDPPAESEMGSTASNAPDVSSEIDAVPIGEPQIFELNPESLLRAALPTAQLEDGWVRMFDGQSLFGWFVVGKANWSIDDDTVRVSRGERSYLCSSFQLSNYEFKVDFRSDADTNSGIFLRTGPQPENVGEDCLELNIAPADNPYPTGSFVERKKLEPSELNATLGKSFDPTEWHTYHVKLEGNSVEVLLDGKRVMELQDFNAKPIGHISLQHNSGRVEFRNILMRPTKGTALPLDDSWDKAWTKSTKTEAQLDVQAVEDGLQLVGGLGQIQSNDDFGDFFLQTAYTLAKPEVNSGIFFRCIRDNMLDGYECQVNHATEGGDVLRPADAGAGAIFRRQNARIVMGDGTTKTYLSILANGPQIVTWVNGVQVAEFYDSREPNDNPRRGLRTEPGPVSIQAHDPETNVTFHKLQITDL